LLTTVDADEKPPAPPLTAAEWAERTERTGVISLHDAPIELRERLKQLAEQHWAMWVDIPVPALNNMTPREAAKTKEGRDLLESLLLYYEHQKANERVDEFEDGSGISDLGVSQNAIHELHERVLYFASSWINSQFGK
jgi:hypothetical protein